MTVANLKRVNCDHLSGFLCSNLLIWSRILVYISPSIQAFSQRVYKPSIFMYTIYHILLDTQSDCHRKRM